MNFTKLFLKAKHWQLFVLFVTPIVMMQIVSYNPYLNNFLEFTNKPPDPKEVFLLMLNHFKYLPYLVLLMLVLNSAWIWSLTIGLKHKLPKDVKLNFTRFKLFFFIPVIYVLVLCYSSHTFITNISIDSFPDSNEIFDIIRYVPVFILFHLFAMFCIFHSIYFAAKTLKTVLLKKKINNSDFIGEFFLIWLSFVGVWILQPKINEIAEE